MWTAIPRAIHRRRRVIVSGAASQQVALPWAFSLRCIASGTAGPADSSAGARRDSSHDRRVRAIGGGASGSQRRRREERKFTAAPHGGRDTFVEVDHTTEDVAADVERHFPLAMSFLKAPPADEAVAAKHRELAWKDEVRTLTADGLLVRSEFSPTRSRSVAGSFFDEGGVDIRSTKRRRERDPVAEEEVISPDILKLTGGHERRHGLAVDTKSNMAPADVTLEMDEGGTSTWGDTPVHLTDMLKERLMELKAEKLSEDRNDAYLPRRLNLAPDSLIERAKRQLPRVHSTQDLVPGQLADVSRRSSKAHVTLADLQPGDPEGESSEELSRRRKAAENLLRDAGALVPGGAPFDPLTATAASHSAGRRVRPLLGRADGSLAEPTNADDDGAVYLFRTIQRASLSSRREALAIVSSGQVRVDGRVERDPFQRVRAENDIHIHGHAERLRFAPPRLWMYHKPANVIVSRRDVAGRTLITRHARILGFDHLIPVGSLPMRSHGVLLLTNDGELSRYLENPKTMVQQTYLLRVRPAVDAVLAHKLNTKGLFINGESHKNVEFFVNPAAKSRFSLKVKVRGESMPISHLLQHLGRTIERGGRVSFGPFSCRNLAVGSIREVTVPPFYMKHVGNVWKPFIERDWPYFRRQRVSKLRKLSRYRELTPKEVEELSNFTYDELKDALSFDANELAHEAAKAASAMSVRPELGEQALAAPLTFNAGSDDWENVPQESQGTNDIIVEDITAL